MLASGVQHRVSTSIYYTLLTPTSTLLSVTNVIIILLSIFPMLYFSSETYFLFVILFFYFIFYLWLTYFITGIRLHFNAYLQILIKHIKIMKLFPIQTPWDFKVKINRQLINWWADRYIYYWDFVKKTMCFNNQPIFDRTDKYFHFNNLTTYSLLPG